MKMIELKSMISRKYEVNYDDDVVEEGWMVMFCLLTRNCYSCFA